MSQPPRYILNLLRMSGLFVLLAAKTNGNLASGAVATGPDAIDVSFNRPFSHVGKFCTPSIYIDDSFTSASAAATNPGAKVHHPIGEKDPVGVRSHPPMTRKAGEKSGSSAKVTAFNRREWRESKEAKGVQFRVPETLPAMTCRPKGTTVWIAMETPCGVRVCFSFKSKRHVVES
ncbi:hypothetical protein BHE74_00004044 [Ensete ventricosum]|nr:hypothetical protein GW17_00001972 [Ensete ventricosum]RWW87162.1 hypothetical protein BHE74_00004044 [Ensete ventricosum]RZR77618.1 hypothetical protein BHM03_00002730 [Ensete ventricosum]